MLVRYLFFLILSHIYCKPTNLTVKKDKTSLTIAEKFVIITTDSWFELYLYSIKRRLRYEKTCYKK